MVLLYMHHFVHFLCLTFYIFTTSAWTHCSGAYKIVFQLSMTQNPNQFFGFRLTYSLLVGVFTSHLEKVYFPFTYVQCQT